MDVDHDGTSGTVDLFSKTTLTNDKMPLNSNTYGTNRHWYLDSSLDNYLETTVYNGFATDVKNALSLMDALTYCASLTTLKRHVIAPSLTELGNAVKESNYAPPSTEGTIYPMFSPACNPNSKSIMYRPNGQNAYNCYWTRSRDMNSNTANSWGISISGGAYYTGYLDNGGVIARIRFAKS